MYDDQTNYGVKKIFEDSSSKSFIIFEINRNSKDLLHLIGHYNFPFSKNMSELKIKKQLQLFLEELNADRIENLDKINYNFKNIIKKNFDYDV